MCGMMGIVITLMVWTYQSCVRKHHAAKEVGVTSVNTPVPVSLKTQFAVKVMMVPAPVSVVSWALIVNQRTHPLVRTISTIVTPCTVTSLACL